ncbi:hypothetical protein AK830_g10966 [Neonectria ditissima]|uniref:Uncharacterized protein n=1 Tax=Neonectria ditissima TaxID=78410 RepID=A0A0N8H5A1_9HYPO|nr:hypothetical protein AK830_g10966 [Neonectria ditissima]
MGAKPQLQLRTPLSRRDGTCETAIRVARGPPSAASYVSPECGTSAGRSGDSPSTMGRWAPPRSNGRRPGPTGSATLDIWGVFPVPGERDKYEYSSEHRCIDGEMRVWVRGGEEAKTGGHLGDETRRDKRWVSRDNRDKAVDGTKGYSTALHCTAHPGPP